MTEQERIDIAYLDTGVYENPWRENLFETLPADRKTAEVCRFAIKKMCIRDSSVVASFRFAEKQREKIYVLDGVELELSSGDAHAVGDDGAGDNWPQQFFTGWVFELSLIHI